MDEVYTQLNASRLCNMNDEEHVDISRHDPSRASLLKYIDMLWARLDLIIDYLPLGIPKDLCSL